MGEKDMSEPAEGAAPLSPLNGLLVLLLIVAAIVGWILLGSKLGVTSFFASFLFLWYWAAVEQADFKQWPQCLCGAVTFTISSALGPPDACHCSQCRKQSGHIWASTDVPKDALSIRGAEKISWFDSSAKVRRGFCSVCGSFLFWDPPARASIAVAMGALDGPTGTHLAHHIFVADKGDYYDIADGLPQNQQ